MENSNKNKKPIIFNDNATLEELNQILNEQTKTEDKDKK